MKQINLNVNGKNINAGYISSGIFTTFKKKSKHFFKKFDGWGLNKQLIEMLNNYDIPYILIKDNENNHKYMISLQDFNKNGVEVNYTEPQIICPQVYFKQIS